MRLPLLFTFAWWTLISIAQTPSAQQSPPLAEAAPASVGMSSDRLARIDSMCIQAIADQQIPGIVALVARDGKIVYHKAFGAADPSGRKLRRDDIFRIASQTKAITSTAVLMLWEEARFALDDPISKYLPEFGEARVLDTVYADGRFDTRLATRPITIRHLLTHTSGIGYGVIDKDPRFKKIYADSGVTDLFTTEPTTIAESVRRLARLPLHHDPGDAVTYSEGLDVLGRFIEVVSGMPLDEFFRTRIFEPLDMRDTYFYLPEPKYARLVSVQKKVDGAWARLPVTFYDPDYPKAGAKTFFSGGAGLSSTARDYATFLQMWLNEGELGGTRLLSRTTVQSAMANQVGNLWGDPGGYYGLAFGVLNDRGQGQGGRMSAGTFGWGGYFNSQYFADPEERIIGIILKQTQGTDNDATERQFRTLVGAAVDD